MDDLENISSEEEFENYNPNIIGFESRKIKIEPRDAPLVANKQPQKTQIIADESVIIGTSERSIKQELLDNCTADSAAISGGSNCIILGVDGSEALAQTDQRVEWLAGATNVQIHCWPSAPSISLVDSQIPCRVMAATNLASDHIN